MSAAAAPSRAPLVVVGAGPVGLVAALDAAVRGVPVVVLEERTGESAGSRAICWAQRTLEILDRLGCGDRVVERGVTWNRGRVFWRQRELYHFDLQPETGHRRPPFVNLQQSLFEGLLGVRARELGVDLRFGHRLASIEQGPGGIALEVATPDGRYALHADWLIAADGARSSVRRALGLSTRGQAFDDHFLIVDVRMDAGFPTERWFWFEPPFHAGGSALLHRQADSVFRLDFQLGAALEDPGRELAPERIAARVRAMLGEAAEFEVVWASLYTFRGVMLERFRAGRVFFAGDSAHLMSPFGARGANSGIQDADNLLWKLALVYRGLAPDRMLDSYDEERVPAARENLEHTGRSTEFIAPKGHGSLVLRDAVLELAAHQPWARALVNSGRLSRPASYAWSSLVTADATPWDGGVPPGAAAVDAPIGWAGGPGFLLERLAPLLVGGFVLLVFAPVAAPLGDALRAAAPELTIVAVYETPPAGASAAGVVSLGDPEGLVRARYTGVWPGRTVGTPGCWVLLRPDGHVAARGASASVATISRALARGTAAIAGG